MFRIELDVNPVTESRLRKILDSSTDPEAFASKVISFQISELKRGITNLLIDLSRLEEKYKISSSEFYSQFQQGKTEDKSDFLIWAGLYEMLQRNEQQLRELE